MLLAIVKGCTPCPRGIFAYLKGYTYCTFVYNKLAVTHENRVYFIVPKFSKFLQKFSKGYMFREKLGNPVL